MGSEFDSMFGLIALASGIYCLYSAFMMKKTGVANTTIVVDKETAKKKCKDIGAFLVMVIPPTFILGGVTTVYGAVSLISVYVVECTIAVFIMLALTMAVLIWFVVVTSKAKKKFY